LAVAFAGLDMFGPDNAFFCVERIRESCRTVSDKCHLLATSVRVRELLHLSTRSTYKLAVDSHLMPKMSEHYVEIVFAHMRALFCRIEDLMLGFIREYVMHAACKRDREICFAKALELKNAILDTLDELFEIAYDFKQFGLKQEEAQSRLTQYRLVINIMMEMVQNLALSNRFSMFELQRMGLKLAEEARFTPHSDWPTFYVYSELANDYFCLANFTLFESRLIELCQAADRVVEYQNSRTVADMLTSALLLNVFGRSMEVPNDPQKVELNLSGILLHRVQKAMSMVPESFVGTDFRSAILFSLKTLSDNPHLRHVQTGTKDTFWNSWMMSDLSHVSDMAYKNFIYVDRERDGLSHFERLHYQNTLGDRVLLSRTDDNEDEVEESEVQRDLRLIEMLRKSNFFMEKAELFGRQRLDYKRRF
jgi:hypothetical protein